MRILLGLTEIAGQMRVTVRELLRLGHNAVFYDHQDMYTVEGMGGNGNRLSEMPKLTDYDVFDVFFASFAPPGGKGVLPNGLKVIHHFCGSEVRNDEIAGSQNPYATPKRAYRGKWEDHMKRLAELTDTCTIKSHELHDHVSEYFENIHEIPRMIDLSTVDALPLTHEDRKPVIVHLPTHQKVKGSQRVIDAVSKLKNTYDFDFYLIAGMPHKMAQRLLSQADLVIDQLHVGDYGQVSIEAMAMGRPVICYISDYMKKYLPESLPIINANPNTIADVLADTLERRDRWEVVGTAGRRYVEKYHDSTENVKKLVEVYESL